MWLLSTFTVKPDHPLSALVTWFQELKGADEIALVAAGFGAFGTVASLLAARAARATVEQMRLEHLRDTRPLLTLRASSANVRALITEDRFYVADPEGFPFGLVLENVGQGRASDLIVTCEMVVNRATRRRLSLARSSSIGHLNGRALAVLTAPSEVSLAWEMPDAAMTVSTWPITERCQMQEVNLDVDEKIVMTLPQELLRAWVNYALALKAEVRLRFRVSCLSGAGELRTSESLIALHPRIQTADGDVLSFRFTAEPVSKTRRRTRAERKADSDRRRQEDRFVADVARSARELVQELAAEYKAAS